MKIYLVGMPGSGKTTLGRQLADALNMPFVDLDKEIETRVLASIADIFKTKGEDHFRRIESQLLHEWANTEKNFVMATGGGAPCFYNGMDVINKTGLSIFLDVAFAELSKRTARDNSRPLLNISEFIEKELKLRELYDARQPVYNRANFRLSNPDIMSLLDAVRTKK